MFMPCPPSETAVLAIKSAGYGERKIWDAATAFSSNGLFRLRAVQLPDLPTLKPKKKPTGTQSASSLDPPKWIAPSIEYDTNSGIYNYPLAPGGPASVNPVS